MLQHDCYEILGVSRDASHEEIRRVYHRLVLQYHPDANPNIPDAAERLRHVVEAYERLRDPASRNQHDKLQKLSATLWEFGSWEQQSSKTYSGPTFSLRPFFFAGLLAATILCAGLAFCRNASIPLEWQEWKPVCMQTRSTLFDSDMIDPSHQWALEFWKRELDMSPSNRFAAYNLAATYENVARSAHRRGNHAMAHRYRQAAMQIRPLRVVRTTRSQTARKS
jgi:curved DNA-binding protein CbpA